MADQEMDHSPPTHLKMRHAPRRHYLLKAQRNPILGKKISHGIFKQRHNRACVEAINHKQTLTAHKLRRATSLNDLDRVKELLGQGVDPNMSDEMFRTPLHLATSRGYTDIVTELLEYGADPLSRDILGNTPLHFAVCSQNPELVAALLAHGAKPDLPDSRGVSPKGLFQSSLKYLQLRMRRGLTEQEQQQKQRQVNDVLSLLVNSSTCTDQEDLDVVHNEWMRENVKNDDYVKNLQNELKNLSLISNKDHV